MHLNVRVWPQWSGGADDLPSELELVIPWVDPVRYVGTESQHWFLGYSIANHVEERVGVRPDDFSFEILGEVEEGA
jgi:hypothetical protein